MVCVTIQILVVSINIKGILWYITCIGWRQRESVNQEWINISPFPICFEYLVLPQYGTLRWGVQRTQPIALSFSFFVS